MKNYQMVQITDTHDGLVTIGFKCGRVNGRFVPIYVLACDGKKSEHYKSESVTFIPLSSWRYNVVTL